MVRLLEENGEQSTKNSEKSSEKSAKKALERQQAARGSSKSNKSNKSYRSQDDDAFVECMDLEKGDIVEANYKGRGHWFPATIQRVRKDGTYDLSYNENQHLHFEEGWKALVSNADPLQEANFDYQVRNFFKNNVMRKARHAVEMAQMDEVYNQNHLVCLSMSISRGLNLIH